MDKLTFKFVRLLKGMEQKEFAEMLGVSYSLVNAIEASRLKVSRRTKSRLLSALDLTDAKLVELEEASNAIK
ncbi:helix-turn-helix transcriptional regulator, partial [Staphylococcus sp. SIMBA_130]